MAQRYSSSSIGDIVWYGFKVHTLFLRFGPSSRSVGYFHNRRTDLVSTIFTHWKLSAGDVMIHRDDPGVFGLPFHRRHSRKIRK